MTTTPNPDPRDRPKLNWLKSSLLDPFTGSSDWHGHAVLISSFLVVLFFTFLFQRYMVGRRFDHWQQKAAVNFYTEMPLDFSVADNVAKANLYQRVLITQDTQAVVEKLGILEENRPILEELKTTLDRVTSTTISDPTLQNQLKTEANKFTEVVKNLNTSIGFIQSLEADLQRQNLLISEQLCTIVLATTQGKQKPTKLQEIQQRFKKVNNREELQPLDCNHGQADGIFFPSEYRDEVMTLILVAGLDATEGEKLRLIQQINTATIKGEQSLAKARYYYINLVASMWMVLPLGLIAGFTLFLISQKGWSQAHKYQKTIFITASSTLLLMVQIPLLLKYEDNYGSNKDLFVSYERIQNELRSYLSTSYASGSLNTSNMQTPGDQAPAQIKPRDFILYIDTRLATLNQFAIDLDPSILPDYSNFTPYFNVPSDQVPSDQEERTEGGTGAPPPQTGGGG